MRDRHWLRIKSRVNFKIILITFKAIHGLAPTYLSNLLSIKSSAYRLRSADSRLLTIPSVRTKVTLGDRAFIISATKLCNSLSKELRLIDNTYTFKRHLKTYLFRFNLLIF